MADIVGCDQNNYGIHNGVRVGWIQHSVSRSDWVMSPSISISTVKFQLFHAHIPVLGALLQGCLIHATREYGCSVQTARVYGPSTRPKFTGSVESAPVKTGREHGPWARVVCVYEPWVRDWWDVTDSWSEPAGKPAERRRLWWFRRRLQRGCFNSVLDCLSVIQHITLLAVLYKYVSEPICFSW